jgi:tetratricopeptide (TPR) repeat protein
MRGTRTLQQTLALALAGSTLGFAGGMAHAKDIGPRSPACDQASRGSAAWRDCIGRTASAATDAELFYAGYWLAKSGDYQAALAYLRRAQAPDARILTYIGFATRKLGDTDGALGYYARALAMNPDYTVARAYLGEAFLIKDEPAKAKIELAEIEKRCGTACAEYAELAEHIARYETAHRSG